LVSDEFIKRQAEEAVRIATRRRILNQWSTATVDELLDILERGAYAPPMGRRYDSAIIVEHLWELHSDELTPVIQDRLRLLIGSAMLPERASPECNAYLLALRGERDELIKLWRSGGTPIIVLLDCLCHIEIVDELVVNENIWNDCTNRPLICNSFRGHDGGRQIEVCPRNSGCCHHQKNNLREHTGGRCGKRSGAGTLRD
jgi:hypothetical protein